MVAAEKVEGVRASAVKVPEALVLLVAVRPLRFAFDDSVDPPPGGVPPPGGAPSSLSAMVRVRVCALSTGLTLVASRTMVSSSSSIASSVTVIVAVPSVDPAAIFMVVDDRV